MFCGSIDSILMPDCAEQCRLPFCDVAERLQHISTSAMRGCNVRVQTCVDRAARSAATGKGRFAPRKTGKCEWQESIQLSQDRLGG
jgi:hypothetical protein